MEARLHPGKIKICGLTKREDVALVGEMSFGAAGFILYNKSPRFVKNDTLVALAGGLPPFVKRIGVTVNPTIDELKIWQETGAIDIFQLHGDETAAYCHEIKKIGIPFVKAFRVSRENPLPDFSAYPPGVFLIDSFAKDHYGGTGKTIDLILAQEIADKYSIILSGGINGENVIKLWKEVKPVAMDLSSGVEESPGIKDHALMRNFYQLMA